MPQTLEIEEIFLSEERDSKVHPTRKL